MKLRRHLSVLIVCLVVLVLLLGLVILERASPREPACGGKRLSAWLDDLARQKRPGLVDTNGAPARAVRAMGTNAIPWLLVELRWKGRPWQMRINQLLAKQPLLKFRFPDQNQRLARATFGFEALGDLGAPAVPSLLSMVEGNPGYVPSALAGIGPPALPALEQCLTNTKSYSTSVGPLIIIPANTIGALHNAMNAGRISKSDVSNLVPIIRFWAQSTNAHAARYASSFLKDFD